MLYAYEFFSSQCQPNKFKLMYFTKEQIGQYNLNTATMYEILKCSHWDNKRSEHVQDKLYPLQDKFILWFSII